MGEQRRRKASAGQYITHVDFRTEEAVQVKMAGMSYSEYARYAAKLTTHPEMPANVPCGSCTACCYHQRIDVDRAVEPPERLLHLDLVPDAIGDMKLRKNPETGACVHLIDGKCSVYQYRPTGCRRYDCRGLGWIGLTVEHDGGQREPVWEFGIPTMKDKLLNASIMWLGEQFRATRPEPIDPIELNNHIATNLMQAMEMMEVAWKADDEMMQHMTANERKNYRRHMVATHAAEPPALRPSDEETRRLESQMT
jgi:hypothetical protein